jgi:hypothetical protein
MVHTELSPTQDIYAIHIMGRPFATTNLELLNSSRNEAVVLQFTSAKAALRFVIIDRFTIMLTIMYRAIVASATLGDQRN